MCPTFQEDDTRIAHVSFYAGRVSFERSSTRPTPTITCKGMDTFHSWPVDPTPTCRSQPRVSSANAPIVRTSSHVRAGLAEAYSCSYRQLTFGDSKRPAI